MSDSLDMTGKVAFVTGASSIGIGSDAAKELARHGAKVFLVARRGEELAKRCAEIEAEGGEAAWAVCDVREEAQVRDAVAACVERFGGVDILIPSAGIAGNPFDPLGFDVADWNDVVSTNLFGVYYAIKYCHEHLKASGDGSIVIILSEASLKVAGYLPYTATKGALLRMMPWLAKNLGPEGIRVNAIVPGLIDTEMTNPPGYDTTEMLFVPKAQVVPLHRNATRQDCSNAILFLCSEMAHNVTGQYIAVDAGDWMVE